MPHVQKGYFNGNSESALDLAKCFKYEPSVNLSLEDIFAPLVHPTHTKTGNTIRSHGLSVSQSWMQTSGSKSSSLSSCQSGKKCGKKRRKRSSTCNHIINSDSEGDPDLQTHRLRKAIVKFTMNPKDFDYFTHVVYSDEDKCHQHERVHVSFAPGSKVCCHENILCLTLVELLQCIISIQSQLAMHETELKHLSSPLLATQDILQFSLDTFSSMVAEFKHLEQKGNDTADIRQLLSGMLRLVFSSMQRFLKSNDNVPNTGLNHNKNEVISQDNADAETISDKTDEKEERLEEENEDTKDIKEVVYTDSGSEVSKVEDTELEDQKATSPIPNEFVEDHADLENFKNIDSQTLALKYAGLGELWNAVTEVLHTSSEFQAYLAASGIRSLVAPLLVNITQDLARASSGALGLSSVVLEQLSVTFSLMHSLLTFVIVTYPYAGLHVDTLLNELRSPLLRYSPRTCGDVKHLVSVMLQCCVLSSSTNITYSLPHTTQALEMLDEEPGTVGGEGEQHPGETDGYEADTEQLANNTYPSSARSWQQDDNLECPELVLLALDLIINHHEKFLETREEAQEEVGTGPEIHDQQEKHMPESPVKKRGQNRRRWSRRRRLKDGSKSPSKGSGARSASGDKSTSSASSVYHSMTSDDDTGSDTGNSDGTEWANEPKPEILESEKVQVKPGLSANVSVENDSCVENACSTNSFENVSSQSANDYKARAQGTMLQSTSQDESLSKGMSWSSGEATSPQHTVHTGPSSTYSSCCESEMTHSASLTQCVHALLLLCRSSANVCRRLHALGFLTSLLNGFTDLICANSDKEASGACVARVRGVRAARSTRLRRYRENPHNF
ncbi:hypothetical protein C7M84_001547 [Penaeus vannamei]|uniref:Uncharacterized protein n=1 Tax=Penaeus vannamei TaxID=6689 RepID=A0A423TTH6_PENVA|nr:hypothetical protein C7M84_001547 [Penaeus vannamei]